MRGMTTVLRRAALLAAAALACGRGDLDASDADARARAVRAMGARGGDASLAALLVAVRDGSPLVRVAAAEAFAVRGGASGADALGTLLADPVPEVATAAARGLGALPAEAGARDRLVERYADATPAGRAAIADALDRLGVSLREAVSAEALTLWERNLAALERGTGAARAGAAEEVGASARADAVQRLVPLVDPNRNPDRLLAAAAARGLGESGDWDARPPLEVLLSDEDVSLAETAAVALGRLGDPAAADALAAAAVAIPGRVATAAGGALAALPDAPDVGVALCDLALRSPDPVVAARAARAAGARDAACPERPLLARLGRPGTLAALAALGELGLSRAAAEAAAARVVPILDPARTADATVRRAAVAALGRLGGASAVAAVGRRAEALASRVAERRARWGPPPPAGAPPEWIPAVAVEDADELGAVLAAAGRLRLTGVEALLLPWARDPLPAVRAGAVEGLAHVATGPAFEAVARALEDADRRVRLAAVHGLARQGAQGVPALVRAVQAPSDDAEWLAALARALGDTGSADAVPVLAQLLDGPAAGAAAAALARIGTPAGAAPLAAHLARPGAPARAEVIEALAQLAARESAPAIAALLTDDRPEVRGSAARALGRLGHEPAAGRLEALRGDYYGRVRRAAVEALAKLPTGAPRARR
jgi:HEAT repeat protein